MATAAKDARLNLRLTTRDNEIIRSAAETRGQSVSDFLTESAVQKAYDVLADQRQFQLDDATWDAFLSIVDRPARAREELVELFSARSAIDRD